jgi:hypothetical protein
MFADLSVRPVSGLTNALNHAGDSPSRVPRSGFRIRRFSFTVAGAAPGLVPVNDQNAHRLPVSLAVIHDQYRKDSEAPDNFADDANCRNTDWQAGHASRSIRASADPFGRLLD